MSFARLHTAMVQPLPLYRVDALIPVATLVFTVNFVAYFFLPDLLPDVWRWLLSRPGPGKHWNHARAVATLRNYARVVLPLETVAYFLWYWADHANWALCYDTTGRWSLRDYEMRGCPSREAILFDCLLYLLIVDCGGRLLVFLSCRAGDPIESPLEVMPRDTRSAAIWVAIHVVPLFGLGHLAPPEVLALGVVAHSLRAYANFGGRACGGLVSFGAAAAKEDPPVPVEQASPVAKPYTPLPTDKD
jgi:hypothetical protein